jgi:hypothetical protein
MINTADLVNSDIIFTVSSPRLKNSYRLDPSDEQTKPLFYEWLSLQIPRNDVIGDLARNVLTDPGVKRLSNHQDDWHCYLHSRATSAIKLIALRYAWGEYQRFLILQTSCH